MESTGYMGFTFDWISYANVYVVSVCEHPCDLRILCPGGCCNVCMFLVDFLDFVEVLCHSGVFENVVFYGGLYPFYVRVGGGVSLFHISGKRIWVRRESFLGGLKTKVRGTFGNLNVPPRGFCQLWWNA